MRSPSHQFPDITAKDIRAVKRLTAHLVEAPNLDTLGRELLQGAQTVLPADFMVWNIWTLQMDSLLGFEANHHQLRDEVEQRAEALSATIQFHPVIAAGKLDRTQLRPQRMSDFESDASFRSNPLFQEVYRHLESNYQIGYNAIRLEDSQILLSWNLKNRDFHDREVQLLHLIGLQVSVLSRRIEERRHLLKACNALVLGLGQISGVNHSITAAASSLRANDGLILSALIRGETRTDIATSLDWRRDTLDRHLGSLRERLGFENTSQLMQSLAALRAAQMKTRPTNS